MLFLKAGIWGAFFKLKKKIKKREKKLPPLCFLADDQVLVETEQQVHEMPELPGQCCDSVEVLR